MTVTAANLGGTPIVAGVAYYTSTDATGKHLVDPGSGSSAFHDPDPNFQYGVVNIAQTQDADPSLSGALSFNISSTSTIAPPANSNQVAVVLITVTGNGAGGSTTPKYVPIAGINGRNCATGGCYGISTVNFAGVHHAYAVPYTQGAQISLQLYPKDICTDYALQSSLVQPFGCDTTGNVQFGNPTGTPVAAGVPMQLSWQIAYIDANNAVTGAALDTLSLNLQFQATPQAWTCPTNLAQRYFPGDGLITMDATSFVSGGVGYTPQSNLIAVGKLQSSRTTAAVPVLDATYVNGPPVDDFFWPVGFGGGEVIHGFVNTTDGTDNTYTLGFMVRDAGGLISPTPASGADANGHCTQAGIQTATVNTFLKQSKCFIATAAFRSMDASPVTLLRQFRDQVLLKNGFGTQFVDWYYRWSPPAAEWLIRHPQARMPVLEALVPVEVTAWFMLHPMQFTLILIFLGSSVILGVIFTIVIKARKRIQE